jgi:DNA-binding Lrp family transcriptional regulator
MGELDELDSAILGELQQNARLSNRELADRLQVAPSTALVRVRSLRERGYITGYHAAVDLAKVGRGLQAMLSVQVRPLNRAVIEGFQTWALGLPEVLSVYVVAGDDDFLVHVAVADVDSLHAFLMDNFSQRREIIRFRSAIIYQHTQRRQLR